MPGEPNEEATNRGAATSQHGRRRGGSIAAAVMLAAIGGGIGARGVANDLATPRDLHGERHVGSGACARCHPDHTASWRRTFHRTMTQDASTEGAVLGAFDGRALAYGGITARMLRDGDDHVIEIDGAPHVVDRTVGSRRDQQYLERRDDGTWWRLPIAWDVEEQRFFHMNAAFLTPDPAALGTSRIARADFDRHVTRWNDNCVFCHNVAADPGLAPDGARFETEVAELGVACEACHGPGSEHAARNRDPIRRYWLHGGDAPDPTIVSPARLDPARSADVCGRCHGQRITDEVGAFLADGDPFVPGDDLALYSSPLWHDTTLGGREGAFETRFWGDGTPRLTAYEYQGLLQSRCASEAALTCTDCHAMHDGDPRGQLRPDRAGDAMCAGTCHGELASHAAARAHARHDDVRCVDCHMPRIVYGIRGVHRSHRIDVPRATEDARAGRTDACSLCHLESSAGDGDPAWARALAGDPIQRAVVLAAIGRDEAPGPRDARLGLLLSAMRDDPYPALRHVAWRALRSAASARALAPSLFTATDPPAIRARALEAITVRLDEPVSPPDPALAAALRARAAEIAIEIGE